MAPAEHPCKYAWLLNVLIASYPPTLNCLNLLLCYTKGFVFLNNFLFQETAQEKAMREAMSLQVIKEKNEEMWKNRLLLMKIGQKAYLRNKTKSRA